MKNIFLMISLIALTTSCGPGITPIADEVDSSGCGGTKKLFAFPNATGNLGGVSGADAICNNSVYKPACSGSYKAFLVGTVRVACTTSNCGGGPSEHTDWVFTANTTYYAPDGTTSILTTDANALPATIHAQLGDYLTPTYNNGSHWSGLNGDWTNSGDDCSNWSDGTGGDTTELGDFGTSGSPASVTDYTSGGSKNCDDSLSNILCVEQ